MWGGSVLFEEDALGRALLGGLQDPELEAFVDMDGSGSPARQELGSVAHVGQISVNDEEHIRAQLLTDPIADTQILVNPYPHGLSMSLGRSSTG